MAKNYGSLTFNDYPPTEILEKDFYRESHKVLSFQYRTKNDDSLIAYIALKKEKANIECINQLSGCRILKVWVRTIGVGRYVVDNAVLRMALLDEAESLIKCWLNNHTRETEFDYLWCYEVDIEKKEIIDEIGEMEHVDNIYYKVFDRPNVIH